MKPQVEAVRSVLGRRSEWREVPVTAALLFMAEEDWSFFALRPLRLGSVYVLWGKALGKLIRAAGNVETADLVEIERALASSLAAA